MENCNCCRWSDLYCDHAGRKYESWNFNFRIFTDHYTVVAGPVGIILEFFVFGGDYTRTERLEYEDDDYYYYVKAVPKALVATSERSIKKINGESAREERKSAERVVNYSTPLFQGEEPPKKKKRVQETEAASVVQKADIDDIDFEKKLEESLKDL